MSVPEFLGIKCVCYEPEEGLSCICANEERALRGYAAGLVLPPMTAAQREWCLSEIDSVEGYRRKEYETETDKDLARGVLHAWVDFCRDKGLL
jgi:hypothetical protein